MKPPPLLTGDEAKLNDVVRELTGKYTEADMAINRWIWEEYVRTLPASESYNPVLGQQCIFWYGEQIWPPPKVK